MFAMDATRPPHHAPRGDFTKCFASFFSHLWRYGRLTEVPRWNFPLDLRRDVLTALFITHNPKLSFSSPPTLTPLSIANIVTFVTAVVFIVVLRFRSFLASQSSTLHCGACGPRSQLFIKGMVCTIQSILILKWMVLKPFRKIYHRVSKHLKIRISDTISKVLKKILIKFWIF